MPVTSRTSVIIPVRNGERFIAEAIGSVLEQLAPDDEIVVVDDVSTDNTRSVLARMRDRRIRVQDGSGRGVSSARNIGLAAATGEFIAFLDHDDMWPPHRHAVLLQVLLADVTVDCAIGRLRLRMEHDAIALPQIPDMEGRLALNLNLGAALFRRRIIDMVGGFDEGMQFWEDIDYFVRLAECDYRTSLCDADTLIYRRHSANATCDVEGSKRGITQLIRRKLIRRAGRQSGR
jgi:glycosyltransferase involved in cell wall biosynthesis